MSRENVDRVREAYEHFASTGEPDLDLLHPSIEITQDPLVPGQRTTFHGPQGLVELLASWYESFDGFGVRAEEFLDAGDQVVVLVEPFGRGAASGVELQEHWAHVWTLQDGRAVRMRLYRNPPEALEAAGLSE
jgi:ketosteroid isomerase-like protein